MNHHRLLKSSIAANVILGALLLWSLNRAAVVDERIAQLATASNIIQQTDRAEARVPESNQIVSNANRFRWSQLESTDYRSYVSNLRKVGCPEQTVRDILSADIDSLYEPRRAQVEQAAADCLLTREQLDAQLAGLRDEENSCLASLLGEAKPTKGVAFKEPPWVTARRNVRPVMPLVFGDIDPARLQLDSNQVAVIKQVQLDFQEEIGAQDPTDPAYLQRWNTAQHNADDRLRGLLGSRVYLQCQLRAVH